MGYGDGLDEYGGYKYEGSTFIQWKGTDVCMDFICPECGFHSHLDCDFLYSLICPKCKAVWAIGTSVSVAKITNDKDFWYQNAKCPELDDDELSELKNGS